MVMLKIKVDLKCT